MKLRKIADQEKPLLNYLRWSTETLETKRFVLKENDRGEIMVREMLIILCYILLFIILYIVIYYIISYIILYIVIYYSIYCYILYYIL